MAYNARSGKEQEPCLRVIPLGGLHEIELAAKSGIESLILENEMIKTKDLKKALSTKT